EFDDRGWARSLDLGVVGGGPWGRLAFGGEDPSGRFRVPEGFAIETVAQPSVTGSVVAFTFDFDGHPCVSIERGPIARLRGEVMKTASATRGALVITKARCLDCHKFGDKGVGFGANATTEN